MQEGEGDRGALLLTQRRRDAETRRRRRVINARVGAASITR
jgi:hypothetical protein